MISPDYFGTIRETVGPAYKCPVMVIQGSAGSTAPKYYCSQETPVDAKMPECVCSKTALQDMADNVLRSVSDVMDQIDLR